MQAIPTQTFEPANPDPGKRLEDIAHHLAEIHTAVHKNSKPWTVITKHLPSFEGILQDAYEHFRAMSFNDPAFSRAGEWMLDNFYVVKRTFRQIEEDLPASFINQLPKLDETHLKGNPRVFALAWELIELSQGQIDLTQAAAFIQDYQQVTPLTIGELWALITMLRIGILERLASAAAKLTRMDELPRSGRDTLVFAGSGPASSDPIQEASSTLSNETIVANCFHSLRLLLATDWKDFFERTSRVEQILRKDPAGIYAGMDFDTRNSYRIVIEELARYSIYGEEQVALAAIELARGPGSGTGRGSPGSGTGQDNPDAAMEESIDHRVPERKAHIGFYLRDAGRATLENKLHYRPRFRLRFQRTLLAKPTVTYLGSTAILSLLFVLAILTYAIYSGGSLAQIIITGVIGCGVALEAATTLVNLVATHQVKPQSLPRLDFSEGIPPGNRTMVVVPTLLESTGELNHLLQELELYYLSNPDPQLTYALLTDFGDAPAEHMLEDELLLGLARTGIETLNQKYSKATPFYLFHRQRQWNSSEGVWMGWERKRGKLADFNRLLLNLGDTAYTTQVGNMAILRGSPGSSTGRGSPGSSTGSGIKYVITLDADTSLPQGSANRLIATLAHPLNRAEFSADGNCVVAGYTVLQPRVAIKPTSANRSFFSQIFSGNAGFDLYSFAVSDVYQDLFGEGSYVGKGIYDLVAFERSLKGQVRQNTLLSHDLFEEIYGRAALVTDIVLYEEYPSRYLGYARRLGRWIRGDWQLLPWLFPIVRTQNGMAPNRLSAINLWKIFDNLRRSLLAPTLLALLVAGWLFLPGSPLVWTLLGLLSSALPIGAQIVQEVKHNLGKMTLKELVEPIRLPLTRWALAVLFLPFEALLMLNAIGTTLIRLLIARRHLLQWTTAANTARSFGLNQRYETWSAMAASLILTVLLGIIIAIFNLSSLWVAVPLLGAWLIAPQVAYGISQPVTHIPRLSRKLSAGKSAVWAAERGLFSNSLPVQMITGCPQTIFKSRLWAAWPTTPHRPT